MESKSLKPGFLLDDLEPDLEDALLRNPAQREHDAMIAHIRLRGDPGELEADRLFAREELRDSVRDLRDVLELSQPGLARELGLSRKTLGRIEALERKGSYLPHASTLRKLAAFCRERGWPERAEALERVASWPRRHKYPERKSREGY